MNAIAPKPYCRAKRRSVQPRRLVIFLRPVSGRDEMREADAEAKFLLSRTDLISTRNLRCRWQPIVETGECRFETFDPVIGPVSRLPRLALDPRLLTALAAALW